jgi:RNA polymerase sigma-70 factor (ECF subfamily)
MASGSVDSEAAIHTACDKRDFEAATGLALKRYGAEVLGFLASLTKDYQQAQEAYSLFCESLWLALPRFEWQCALRTWAYMLARHAVTDLHRAEARHKRAQVDFSSARVTEIAELVRSETMSLLRTESRNEFAKMRNELDAEDRALLVLRVDRNLPWLDIARVLGNEAAEPATESARLRKRFQLVKERLYEMGRARGLI